jgi:hypothetical protein
MGRVPSVAQMPALPALGQLPQINPPGPGYKPITNRHKPENEWCGWNWGYWGTPKKISAKDVASGLCPDKLAGKSCISGHRPGTASFVIGLLQRSLKAFGHFSPAVAMRMHGYHGYKDHNAHPGCPAMRDERSSIWANLIQPKFPRHAKSRLVTGIPKAKKIVYFSVPPKNWRLFIAKCYLATLSH